MDQHLPSVQVLVVEDSLEIRELLTRVLEREGATVTAVDPKAKTITMKGPRGNVVTLDVQNPDQFKVVKVGDEVQVVYTEAVAISVEPGPKKADKK